MSARAAVAIVPDAQSDDAADCIVEGSRPLVAPGEYLAGFDTWQTVIMFGGRSAKVVLTFALLEPHVGIRLEKFYNVKRLTGKPRKRGRFVVGGSSDLARDFVNLTGRRDSRLSRFALSDLQGHVYRVRARTVTRDSRQRELPPALQYSVISTVEPE